MEDPLRLLALNVPVDQMRDRLASAELTVAHGPAEALVRLRNNTYDAVLANAEQANEMITRFRRDETILANVDQGIAAIDPNGQISWVNPVLRGWCEADPVGQTLMESLGPSTIASEHPDPFSMAAKGQPIAFRIHRNAPSNQAYIDIRIRPILAHDGTLTQSVAILQNVTAEVEQQKKLSALYDAGRELAALQPDQIAEMDAAARIFMLKNNLRKHIHDLLQYDTIEIRTLDRRTGELELLLQDGMTAEAINRRLFARPEGNGVTGRVAYTGVSYLCPDTASDPYYLTGAEGAHSSLTVPLKFQDEVVGTLNVESPRVNAFGPDDLHFTELFSKGLAEALHTFELLSAQQSCTLSQSIEAVNREIALPVDELLASAALLYSRLHSVDADAAGHLRRIMSNARQVKECVHRVGRTLTDSELEADQRTTLIGKRVLVVEQDERYRRQAHLLLGRLGAEVETVASANEALALLQEVPYDAILQELRPVDMGGYDAFRQFRLSQPIARVALTTGFGYDSQHSIVKARQDGLQHIIFKPFRADQVVAAVTAPIPPPPNNLPITAAAGQS